MFKQYFRILNNEMTTIYNKHFPDFIILISLSWKLKAKLTRAQLFNTTYDFLSILLVIDCIISKSFNLYFMNIIYYL